MEKFKILVINPGSTSTKIAVYENIKSVLLKTLRHSPEELAKYDDIPSQYEFRKEAVLNELKHAGIEVESINAVVGRGGLLRPIPSGVYEVNEKMKNDLKSRSGKQQHASNLGGLIADDIAGSLPNARAFIADPIVVDELHDVARITGLPELPRQSIFHALNQKAVARNYARSVEKNYEELNLIVAHLGGGISIGAHYKGRVIDVNNALDGYGPFSPERAGTLPSGGLVDMCFSGKYSHDEMRKKVTGKGGLMAHLGTNQAHEAEERALNGDKKAELLLHAMSYQVAKNIGACVSVLQGEVDAVLITGGMAQNNTVVGYIRKYIDWIGNIKIYPGEDEMSALAMNALEVLKGEMECKEY
ncbi:MAG: buk [Anaerophaga sp.]|uniref:butyrate kinase n=1 Tax=Anaerophaga thermohalophila TaxID=177400 RepID=UPI000237C465|nr:butyrate kinase [Anaerophaga thermohalophila]MBZ4677368.1 buk [Anaerophaga sp.]MDK2842606.1 butyrate kinase [Anaerophaga sp.]